MNTLHWQPALSIPHHFGDARQEPDIMKNTFLRKRWMAYTALVVMLVSSALISRAQTSAVGNIAGTVTDNTGAAVPAATVVVTNTDTGVTRTTTTNNAGEYNAPFLLPGNYQVVIGGGGFSKINRKNLVLTVGQVLTVDAVLTVGATSTEIEVTSESPILDTDKTEVSQTLGENFLENLPVASRNWSNFVLLTPNVVQDGGSGLISFHGISGLYNQNYVDGSNNNQMLFSEARGRASGAPYVYSVDSIKEFQAETSNYSVEFGQAAGGQVNAITKSGTNAYHGDLFYSLRYPTLNALDPYNKYQALHNNGNPFLLTQPIHQQQQFGGSVGGPIMKDRLFFFFTYDGFRRVGRVLYSNTNIISLTPTPSNSGGTVISPTQCPTTITSTQCTNAISFLLNVGNTSTTSVPPTRFAKQNIFFPRLDYHLSARNDLFVNFNFADFDSTFGYSPAPTFSNSSPSTNGPTSYHERFLVAGLTTQIGKASVNQIHFQFGRDLETAGANAPGPSIASGVVTYGMPNALPRVAEPDEHRIQFTNVFSTTHGHHSIKAGGDVNIVHEVMINLFQGGGVYSYGSSTSQANFQNWVVDAFAGQAGDTDPYAGYRYTSFVQTIDTKNSISSNRAGADDFYMKMFDFFVEDTWKMAPNFTLTAGVRYDLQLTPPPGVNNNNFPPVSTKYSTSIKNVANRVQPRIGFSWSPYPKTVVRGGYGMFSALNQGSTYYAMRVENGIVQVNYNYTGCASTCNATSAAAAGLRFPNVPFPVTGPSLSGALFPSGGAPPTVNGPTAVGAQSFHGLDPNFVPPLAHEAELGVEQALPGKMSLSVGYVGTRALRLPVFVDANLVGQTPHGSRTYNVVNSSNQLINQMTVPVYLISDRIVPTLQSFNTGFSVANTWYNSLAVTLRRPFADGLEALLNYTWARATDTGQVQGNNGTFYGGDTPLDPNNIRKENGPSDIDVRNRFAGSIVYQPQLFQDNKIVKHVVDDFLFSSTVIASAGQPIFLGMSGTVFNGGTGSYGSGGNIYGGALSSSSGAATTGRPPQIGRNSIPGPGFFNMDVRVSRDIPIHEKIKLQFSADAFNVLNHKIVTSVNTTYSAYNAATAPTTSAPNPACNSSTQTPGSTASPLQGCIAPFSGTGLSAFGATSGTNNGLYGSRQMQFSAKLFF
jgi:Carboxypeptidase regulatory-like domain/TonB dependent receptor